MEIHHLPTDAAAQANFSQFLFAPYLLSSVITLFSISVLTGALRALNILDHCSITRQWHFLHPPLAFNKANVALLMSVKVYGSMLEGFYGNEVNRNSRVSLKVWLIVCFCFFGGDIFAFLFLSHETSAAIWTSGKGHCEEAALRDTMT